MNSGAYMPDSLLPQPPGGMAPGAALALLVHAGLIVALTAAVDWRIQTPAPVSAELWAAVPQVAAPKVEEAPTPTPQAPPAPVVAPAPAPARKVAEPAARSDADIATEREQRRKSELEKLRLEAEKQALAEKTLKAEKAAKAELAAKQAQQAQQQRDDETREAKAGEARLALQREENLRRMMGQAAGSAPMGSGAAAQDAAPSLAYTGRLVALIRSNTVFTGQVPGNPAAEVEVRAGANGSIIARRLVKSSGHKDWDEAVLRAVDRTARLPRDSDGRVPPVILISFRPNG